MKLILSKLASKLSKDVAIFDIFTTVVTKVCTFDVEINISDPMDHFDIYIKFHQGRSWHRKIKTNIRSDDISAISTPPGCLWGSTERGEPIEFDFLGLECDHQVLKQLEPKNLSKTGISNQFLLFLSSFLVSAALKLDGRISNLEN